MNTSLKRNQVFELLGTKPTNPRWSWCALSVDRKRAVFTLWKDEMENKKNPLLWKDYDTQRSHGAADQNRTLHLVVEESIPAYGLICIAHDTEAAPRAIKAIETDYLVRLKIEKLGDMFYGHHIGLVPLIDIVQQSKAKSRDGLRDLLDAPLGNEFPDRATISTVVVIRDNTVRNFIIRKSKGKCEFCDRIGFEMKSGRFYVEAHHVIALADDGRDTLSNVIALCPEHHREAHFGSKSEELEAQFLEIISSRGW